MRPSTAAGPGAGARRRHRGVEPYLGAVAACGWTDEQYREWLGELLESLLR